MSESILIIVSERDLRHRLRAELWSVDREVHTASTAREGLDVARLEEPTLILVEVGIPGLPGVRVVDVFRDSFPGSMILALAPEPSIEGAVEAMRRGAVDYLDLPPSEARLKEAVGRALQESRSGHLLARVRAEVRDTYGFNVLVSQSPRMLAVFDQVRAVASTDATVLIRGETGTGKELVSRAIHARSRRAERPCISVNCGAFTETLLESELFGHEKGAFTGAVGRRQGLFEMADGGTLFLDELGETSLNVQVNLLRVLEEMVFRRVGGRELVQVDVRIVAATNVDLENAITEGRFREDLFYRLNVFPIHLPPLRERVEDIPLLMRHFLDELSEAYDLEPPIISAEALQAILAYDWPGNVRQLRTLCERWVITHAGKRLELERLPPALTGIAPRPEVLAAPQLDDDASLKENLSRVTGQVERAYLFRLLRLHEGHLGRVAEAAAVSPRTLYTKMRLHGLDASEFKAGPDRH